MQLMWLANCWAERCECNKALRRTRCARAVNAALGGRIMSTKEKFELHALNLGKLVGNLLTIEMAARMFLAKHEENFQSKVTTQLSQVSEGNLVESDAFTNPDDLRQTLKKYNKRAPDALAIPVNEIVALRDALV